MSNLGAYQWMTTAAKKVGGPVNLMLLVGAGSIFAYKGSEIVIKKGVKKIKQKFNAKKEQLREDSILYEVKVPGQSNEGVLFSVGEQFYVLQIDGNSALIEKVGDGNNPYFVSVDLLSTISDFSEISERQG